MDRKTPISDATITKNAARQLSGRGLRSPCHIQVQTRNGEVTLSGTVQFVHQRDAAVQAIRTVEGIKRVVEKLKVTPPAKRNHQQSAPATQGVASADAAQAAKNTESVENRESVDASPETAEEPVSMPGDMPANDGQSPAAGQVAGLSSAGGTPKQPTQHSPRSGMQHTRKADSYTFECASQEEAERLRALLATYADWLKKNCWVGESKSSGGGHQVTFHAKSVIDFLRQADF